MPVIYLSDRGVVRISGKDAPDFLNNLVTCDVAKITPHHAGFGALLTPQGKVMFDFLIAQAEPQDGGGYFLDTARVLAPALVERLNMYKLRADVVIEDLSDHLGVAATFGDVPVNREEYLVFDDPRLPELGTRMIGERTALTLFDGEPVTYLAHRIALGVPESGKDFAFNDAFPHEALMDQLHGIDFKKGCYVGQEIVARMEHRGTARTRIIPVSYDGGFAPSEGIDVVAGDKVIGRTGSQHQGKGLAIIRLDRLADALNNHVAVTAGGIALVAHKPAFARFEVPFAHA